MNRQEFMRQLEVLLNGISADERQEALQYYEDYFDDAGIEQEANVIRELVSPENVARTIMDGLQTGGSQGEYTEHGYEDIRNRDYQSMAVPGQNGKEQRTKNGNSSNQTNHSNNQNYYKNNSTNNNTNNVNKTLLIIILILTLPFTGGILLGIAGTLFGIIVALISVTAALLIAGIALIGAGIGMMVTVEVVQGILVCGSGFIVLAIGIPCLILCFWTFGKWLPMLFHGIADLCRRVFGNGGVAA